MAPPSQKKRRLEDGMRGKTERPKKRFRKQSEYHSSSEDSNAEDEGGFAAVSLDDSDEGIKARSTPKTKRKSAEQRKKKDGVHSEADAQDQDREDSADEESEQDENISDDDDDDDDANTAGTGANRKRASKRNDPEAFSTSISKILSTKLSKSARKDPVLSRSKQATDTSTSLADEKLERKAKAKLRAERREDLERGRIKDVLGLNSGKAGEIAEEEKRLRKIAQRGVVKLFNAVRAAQVKGEQAAREERKKGTIGIAHREEKVNEMSKQGFLDLIGGKKKTTAV